MPRRTHTRLTKRIIDDAQPGRFVWDSEVPGFGVRVTPNGVKTYIFQYRTLDRRQGKMAIGRYPVLTVDEARKRARELRAGVDQGRNPSVERKSLRDAPTVRDLAIFYCDDYGPKRPLKSQTIRDARRLLNRYVLPRLGYRKIADVRPSDIRSVHAEAAQGSGRYEANRLRAVLSRMFTLAIQNEWRTDNPCKGVEKLPEDQRWRHLTYDEIAALLGACDEYPDQNAANAVRLLLFTGARLQELLKAQWRDFDLDARVWEKPSHHTKTKIVHRIALPEATVALLREMRAEDPDSQFLFPGRNPGQARADLNRPWKRILALAGLQNVRRHDLRRTNASVMLSTGSDLAAVGRFLGHTQASTTQRYAHVFDEVQRAGATRAVDRMLALKRRTGAEPEVLESIATKDPGGPISLVPTTQPLYP